MMKTLKEYSDFLYKNGYEETSKNGEPYTYTFIQGHLRYIWFVKNDNYIKLCVEETKEFSEYLSSLELGTEYKCEYENYIVKFAFIESSICNVANFLDGNTDGIYLALEPNAHYKHSLDLFELCINFQETNLLEHDLFIMSRSLEHLNWAKDNLIPLLEKWGFHASYDSFFDVKEGKRSSNARFDFKHPNRAFFTIETDCLTGKPYIWADSNLPSGSIELTDKIYGKNLDEVSDILLEELLKKDEFKFGYIYNNDPHETIDTYEEVSTLLDCLHYKKKKDINFSIIPKRYEKLVEDYNEMVTKL